MPGSVTVRLAEPAHIPAMQAIEIAAGRLFAEIGMQEVADDGAHETATLARYVSHHRAWVAEVEASVRGYALAEVFDGAGHLEQVSVDPTWGRRGIGRRLVDAVAAWATREGFRSLTLLTFRDVPWNAPYYARLGFAELPDDRLGPELAARRRHEGQLGLDVRAREAMELRLE